MPQKPEITYDDFAKIDIRIGTVVAAEAVPETDRLIKCTIDFGDLGTRTIVSGIRQWKSPEELVGLQLPYVVNLAPRQLCGIESRGMLVAGSFDGTLMLMHPDLKVPPGTPLS
jgi:methionyl-tRNA synthetase